jgi:hypothetical protein
MIKLLVLKDRAWHMEFEAYQMVKPPLRLKRRQYNQG